MLSECNPERSAGLTQVTCADMGCVANVQHGGRKACLFHHELKLCCQFHCTSKVYSWIFSNKHKENKASPGVSFDFHFHYLKQLRVKDLPKSYRLAENSTSNNQGLNTVTLCYLVLLGTDLCSYRSSTKFLKRW